VESGEVTRRQRAKAYQGSVIFKTPDNMSLEKTRKDRARLNSNVRLTNAIMRNLL
jgi:hypothetical protein